jgi:hypothetical protein
VLGGKIGAFTGIPGGATAGTVIGALSGNAIKKIKDNREVTRALQAIPNDSKIGYGPTRAALAALIAAQQGGGGW